VNFWLYNLALSALGLALLAIGAGVAIWALSREPKRAYRFLVLALVFGLVAPGIQLLPVIAVAVSQNETGGARPHEMPRPPLSPNKVEVNVRAVHLERKSSGPGAQKFTYSATQVEFENLPGSSEQWLGGSGAWLLLTIYLTGVLGVLLYQGARLLGTRHFLARCRALTDPQTHRLWEQIAVDSPLRNQVRLLVSDEIRLPCCWGLFTRYLVLPANGSACPADVLGWALRHELVHLERRDSRTALLQMLLVSIYWYHPAAWWLSHEIDWWREASCDAAVVERTGQRRSYALALIHFAGIAGEAMRGRRPSLLHSAVTPNHVRDRVQMLAQHHRCSSHFRRCLSWIGAVGGLAFLSVAQLGGAFAILQPDNAPKFARAVTDQDEQVRKVIQFQKVDSNGRR
jgi:beta-lactamase regulating signal transducer with metallopeptidase domain